MGVASSRTASGLAAEKELLEFGVRYWTDQAGTDTPTVVEIVDVPLSANATGKKQHVHTVWARRVAGNTAEVTVDTMIVAASAVTGATANSTGKALSTASVSAALRAQGSSSSDGGSNGASLVVGSGAPQALIAAARESEERGLAPILSVTLGSVVVFNSTTVFEYCVWVGLVWVLL